MRRLAAAVLVIMAMSLPAYAQIDSSPVTKDDIAQAEAQRRLAGLLLADATARYDEDLHRSEELRSELQELAVAIAIHERELAATRIAARIAVREMYMAAGTSRVSALFDAATITEIPVRASYLDYLSEADATLLARLVAAEASYLEQRGRLDAALAEQEGLVAEIEALAEEILGELEAANAKYDAVVAQWEKQEAERIRREAEERRRREEEERLRREEAARLAALTTTTTTAPPTTTTMVAPTTTTTAAPDETTTTEPQPDETTTTTTPSDESTTTTEAPPDESTTTTTTLPPPPPPPPPPAQACPVDGAVSFVDSYGASRSGGRRHQGVDMIAAKGTRLVALEAGTVKRIGSGGLGGKTVWLRGTTGDEFYYAHLDGFASGLKVGQSLDAGQLLGYVGNTGNAQYTLPHLHFEYHPGGGGAVNPFLLVKGLCG